MEHKGFREWKRLAGQPSSLAWRTQVVTTMVAGPIIVGMVFARDYLVTIHNTETKMRSTKEMGLTKSDGTY